MASINRHAIEISSNTRTSSSSRLCGEDSEARCRRESRPTTNFLLRRSGADHYSSSSSRSGPTPLRVPPATAGSRCEPSVSVPLPPSRSPVPAGPRREAVAPCRPPPGGGGSRPFASASSLLTREDITGPRGGRQAARFIVRSPRFSCVSAGQGWFAHRRKALVLPDVTHA